MNFMPDDVWQSVSEPRTDCLPSCTITKAVDHIVQVVVCNRLERYDLWSSLEKHRQMPLLIFSRWISVRALANAVGAFITAIWPDCPI